MVTKRSSLAPKPIAGPAPAWAALAMAEPIGPAPAWTVMAVVVAHENQGICIILTAHTCTAKIESTPCPPDSTLRRLIPTCLQYKEGMECTYICRASIKLYFCKSYIWGEIRIICYPNKIFMNTCTNFTSLQRSNILENSSLNNCWSWLDLESVKFVT